MPRLMAAALMAAIMFATTPPAHSVEAATPNDTARFLAGLPPASDSPLAALTRDPAWQQHARYFDSIFAREESVSLSKIRAFSRERLTEKHDTMFYMFSGPDFLYAVSFFPSATTYVMSGLEPVGEVPQLTGLPRPTVDGTLRNLESSLGSLLSFSFFITKNMKTQLREGPAYGTLPILYVFLARTGKTIHEVSFGGLDKDGNFQTPDERASADGSGKKSRRSAPTAAPGVKIVFSDGNGPQQTLYYFSTNLADGSFERSGFLTFCSKFGPADSFLKSASYLMHTGGFNRVRDFLLEHSATILQDDSGIPFAYFDPKQWRLQPFGHYVGPLSIFGRPYQERLGELFHKGNAVPLDFGVGYRWRKNESNLLLAQRTAVATSDSELGSHLPVSRYLRGTDAKLRKKGRTTGGAPPTRRKRVESDSTGSFGCPIADVFPFCSDPQSRSGR